MVIINYKAEFTLEQILAFDIDRPETHTTSEFMNAVCRSFAKNGYLNCKEMGRSLGMTDRNFSAAFEALTGLRYAEIRGKLVEQKALELRRKHPHWTTTHIAHRLGFRRLASFWSFMPETAYKQMKAETKTQYLRRMGREFDKQLRLESQD